MKKQQRKAGRPKISNEKPVSVLFTDDQRAYLDSKAQAPGGISEVLRRIVENAMRKEGIKIRR